MKNLKTITFLMLIILVLPVICYTDSEEFRVSTYNYFGANYTPAAAISPDGEFIIIWRSGGDGWYGIHGQKYDRFADPYGEEFTVDPNMKGIISELSLAINNMDEYITVWSSHDSNIKKKIVNAKKLSKNGDTQIKVSVQDHAGFPSLAMDGEGNFVIAYEDYGIFTKKYDHECNLVKSFKVNSDSPYRRTVPSVAMNKNGNFIVAWENYGEKDGTLFVKIFARLYDKNADPLTDEFQVNTNQPSSQGSAAVAMAENGNFVIAWNGSSQDWIGGVYAQLFNSDGIPIGSEFLVNTYTENGQIDPSVGMDSQGNFVVVWRSDWDYSYPSSGQDGSYSGIFAQRFDFNGNPIDNEFQVNTHTYGEQMEQTVAMDSDGDFVIAWSSAHDEKVKYRQVYAKHYQVNPVTNEPSVDIYAKGTFEPTFKAGDTARILVTVDCRYAGAVDMYSCLFLNGNYFWYPLWDNTPHPTVYENEKRWDIIGDVKLSEDSSDYRPIGTYTFLAAITTHGTLDVLDFDSVTITIE